MSLHTRSGEYTFPHTLAVADTLRISEGMFQGLRKILHILRRPADHPIHNTCNFVLLSSIVTYGRAMSTA